MIKRPGSFLIGGLLVGWLADILFWNAIPGISYPIWVLITLGVGFALLYSEGKQPSHWSWLLAGLALLFAILSVAREQPFSAVINFLMSVYLLSILVATLRNGNWLQYRMMDSFMALLRVGFMSMAGFWMLFSRRPSQGEEAPKAAGTWREGWRRAAPWLRGVLLAVPVLLVLGGLLASADPVFSDQIDRLFEWLRFKNLEEFLFRAFYVLCVAYVMAGLYFHAVEREEERPDISKQHLPQFLGLIEASVVLALVNLMFLLFVGIQFIYLFGGQANITATGYTYAEYARRGFFELVGVAVLSLMLYLTLGYITKRETERQKRIFTGLVVAELLLVMVMLVSAFQRMAMYQDAYGFSELRVQVNVLMIWLGILLAATIVLEILHRSRHFGLAALLFCIGFVFTMGVFNMDAFIVEQNVARARQGADLDIEYLTSLSDDATPAIYSQFIAPDLPRGIKDALGGELACRSARAYSSVYRSWLSLRFSKQAAYDLLTQHGVEWQQYECPYYSDYYQDW